MHSVKIDLWYMQCWDRTLGVYLNPQAAKAHGERDIHDHYRHHMDHNRVLDSHRVVDWRVGCCGHLQGPGQLNHTDRPDDHTESCWQKGSGPVALHPFWAADGKTVRTGHVSTAWEISRGVARGQFDPAVRI